MKIRTTKIPRFIVMLLLVATTLVPIAANAYAWPGRLLLAQAVGLSQDEAAAKVREDTGGRVLGVETATQDGLAVYLVKVLLPDGRVRVVTVSSQ